MPPRHFYVVAFVTALLSIAAGNVGADDYDIGSLASKFLQSKTRGSVLDREDKAASACNEKLFVRADPVRAPEVRVIEGIAERMWREIWTVARCGANVYYMIFFTEQGSGGASYGIAGPGTLEEIEQYKDALPASQPPSQDFWIYFDSAKSELRADAARTLESVVDAALKRGIPKVVLAGHADTMGGSGYNQRLSEQRAMAVRTYLVRHGIPVADITTVGKGKTDLRVMTPDQMREQENRNVHIEVE
jgi:outer membrane protein OmpA-like peptidoglycan-associated protein